jgi:hypothetical protein
MAAHTKRPDLYDGIGRMFAPEAAFAGVDLDDCRAPETGEIEERAMSIIRRLHSHAEISPSGKGVKIWCRAKLPAGRRKKPGLETYDRGRYFTLTGWHLAGTPYSVEPRQVEIEALLREEFSEPERQPRKPYSGPDRAHLELAELLESANVPILGEAPDQTAERVYRIVCPWSQEHTGGDLSGTRAGQYPGGALFFHCEHAHCAHRGWDEFKDRLSPPAVFLRRRSRARRVRSGTGGRR